MYIREDIDDILLTTNIRDLTIELWTDYQINYWKWLIRIENDITDLIDLVWLNDDIGYNINEDLLYLSNIFITNRIELVNSVECKLEADLYYDHISAKHYLSIIDEHLKFNNEGLSTEDINISIHDIRRKLSITLYHE